MKEALMNSRAHEEKAVADLESYFTLFQSMESTIKTLRQEKAKAIEERNELKGRYVKLANCQ